MSNVAKLIDTIQNFRYLQEYQLLAGNSVLDFVGYSSLRVSVRVIWG